MTDQEEFTSIYDEALATTDLGKAYHLARKLCHLSLTKLQTRKSYHQLVTVAAKHPSCAGMIYDRMSKAENMQIHLASVIFKASGYMFEMDIARQNGHKLDKANLTGIASIASFNPKAALVILGGYRDLSEGLNESAVVEAMMRIVSKHPEVRESGLTRVFERQTPQSLIAVSHAIDKKENEDASPLAVKVFEALKARFKNASAITSCNAPILPSVSPFHQQPA